MSDSNYITQFIQEELNNEEWRKIPMFDGIYSASNLGRVRRDVGGVSTYAGRIIIPIKKRRGYYGVCLRLNGKNKNIMIHTLVALAFIGCRPKGFDVNHIDGIKANNRPNNLEYITHGDNMHHAARLGLFPKKTHCKHGHELTQDNRYVRKDGYSQCLICYRERHRRYDRKRRHPISSI